jgi:hypothetical protein
MKIMHPENKELPIAPMPPASRGIDRRAPMVKMMGQAGGRKDQEDAASGGDVRLVAFQ